ncbi:hypothetical protein A6C57_27780 (plasmid) [Fibrella sp. ES10-3-2-2]
MKKELNYGSQFGDGFVIIVPLQGGESVYNHLDEILIEIETKIGPIGRRHIICEGDDGFWDLILPREKLGLKETQIYPLSARSLEEAKERLARLMGGGDIGLYRETSIWE